MQGGEILTMVFQQRRFNNINRQLGIKEDQYLPQICTNVFLEFYGKFLGNVPVRNFLTVFLNGTGDVLFLTVALRVHKEHKISQRRYE